MNRLVIIGNGFDMAHGLKTSYMNFIDWYWEQRVKSFVGNTSCISEDCLCKLVCKTECWNVFAYSNSYFFKDLLHTEKFSGSEIVQYIKNIPQDFTIECSPFFETILKSIETKGWVDIENDYYQMLKNNIDNPNYCTCVSELNEQLAFLQRQLIEYLQTVGTVEMKNDLAGEIFDNFNPTDFSTEGKKKALDNIGLDISECNGFLHNFEVRKKLFPEQTMLLSFNYTNTANYYGNDNTIHNYIHGELEHPENIIFGYGDELDKRYQDILDINDNAFLKNVKSVRYLETRHYHDLLEFLLAAPFQVLIMGHSCGNSDRTLLNTVFEHENCISIKPYYHKWEDGRDNYLELVQNISRNFTNMKLFRDRVVNKEQCKLM